MALNFVSRAYVLDVNNNILLVRHHKNSPWVLPGGHLEANENPVRALRRELKEELQLDIEILGITSRTNDPSVMIIPLPVSMQEIEYFDESKDKLIRKCEFWYFVRVAQPMVQENKEIHDSQRFSPEEFLSLEAPSEVFQVMKDVFEQNEDLLELLG